MQDHKLLPAERLEQLAADVSALRRESQACIGDADFRHLKKIENWGRLCTLIGYLTAWIGPNPISAALISQGNFSRWALITHPISHGAYNSITGVPRRYTSRVFARGWRRLVDWMDWIDPAAWTIEHNQLHHFRLGETADPDLVEFNMEWLRGSKLPLFMKYIVVAGFACIWKPIFYAPNTLKEARALASKQRGEPLPGTFLNWSSWLPTSPAGRELWLRCYLPYIGVRFVLLPALFLPLGTWAAISVLINSLLAEVFTNLHSFLVIVPNHTGDDIPRFDAPVGSKGEFYYRQITGSVNYRTGSDFNDFLHGWLNYQIEHHLWPDFPLRQYQRLQPVVAKLCEEYGLPYQQQSVFTRLRKTLDIMVGRTTMPRMDEIPQFYVSTETQTG